MLDSLDYVKRNSRNSLLQNSVPLSERETFTKNPNLFSHFFTYFLKQSRLSDLCWRNFTVSKANAQSLNSI